MKHFLPCYIGDERVGFLQPSVMTLKNGQQQCIFKTDEGSATVDVKRKTFIEPMFKQSGSKAERIAALIAAGVPVGFCPIKIDRESSWREFVCSWNSFDFTNNVQAHHDLYDDDRFCSEEDTVARGIYQTADLVAFEDVLTLAGISPAQVQAQWKSEYVTWKTGIEVPRAVSAPLPPDWADLSEPKTSPSLLDRLRSFVGA